MRAAAGRRNRRAADAVRPFLSLFLFSVLGACERAREPAQPTASLRLHGQPPNASVSVDDQRLGSLQFVEAHGVALPPGVHHVTVTAEGHLPWDREVDAKVGSPPITLTVALTPVPD
jgi:hypothetical protein